MSRGISSPVFIGREAQLASARAVVADVLAGTGRTLLVGGEAGIGKSRFVRELAALPEARGIRFLVGRCLGVAGSVPYAPFREALASLAEADGPVDPDLATVMGEDGPASTASPGRDAGTVNRSASDASRIFELALRVIRRSSADSPVAVVVEDLHWARASTLALFAYLGGHAGRLPFLLVGTFRTDIGRGHRLRPVLAQFDREHSVERIELPRLTPDEVGKLVAAIRTTTPDRTAVAGLAQRTAGIPLFVEEILALGDDPAAQLPASLRETLQQRLRAVSDDAQAVMRVAAAAGVRFDERVVAALTERPDAALWRALRELVDANLLVPDETRERAIYGFRHALLREAVDDELLPGERIRLHARIAEFLEAHPDAAVGGPLGAVGDIADHWEAGRDLARALPAHLQAARAATVLFAFPEALRHLERAVLLWDRVDPGVTPPGTRRSEVLAQAAEAAALSGRHERAIEMGRLALADVDRDAEPQVAARMLERLGQYLWEAGDDSGGQAARTEALGLLSGGDSADRARLLASLASALVVAGRHEEAGPMATEALRVALAAGAEEQEGAIRNTLGVLAAAAGNVDEALGQMFAARQIATRLGSPYQRVRAYANHAAVLGNAGRLGEALAVATEGAEVARELGLFGPYGRFLVANAIAALYALGEWDEADRLATEALAEPSSGVLAAHLHLAKAQLLIGRGRFHEGERHLVTAAARASGSEDPSLISSLAATRAELALWRGDPDAAWDSIEAALGRLAVPPPELLPLAGRAAADRAERARLRRQPATSFASALASVMARYRNARHEGGTDPAGPADPAILAATAEAGRVEGRSEPAAFAAAADAFETSGMPYPAAYLRFREAEAMLTRSRVRTDAARILAVARRVAASLGGQPLADEIDGLARRARVEVVDETEPSDLAVEAAPSAQLGLTQRELEVLGLLASGMTNRQIADELFISPKTAGAHVSNIIGKLGVSGRVEAATIAERLGLTAGPPADRE